MMDTKRSKLRKAGHYLRELSVVVIGVAITLALTNYLSNHSEKQDTKLYLNAIKLELEENLLDFDDIIAAMESSMNYSRYILTHDKKTLNPDTIQSYASVYFELKIYTCMSNAFEMLKASGNMRHVKDKEMMQSVWLAYAYLNMAKRSHDNYYEIKTKELLKEAQLAAEGKEVAVPMYVFYYYEMESSLIYTCENAAKYIKETIAMLEKEVKN